MKRIILLLIILGVMVFSSLEISAEQKGYQITNQVVTFDVIKYWHENNITDAQFRADMLYFLVTLQGIVNRSAPRLYLEGTYNLFQVEVAVHHPVEFKLDKVTHLDRFWLDYMKKKGWVKEDNLVEAKSLLEVCQRFSGDATGLVLWELAVPATVNVAQMAGGAKGLLPVRKDKATGSFHAWVLKNVPGLVVKLNLAGVFEGEGKVNCDGIVFTSSGSAKNDAYRFAIKRFLTPGLLDPFFMWYNCDARDWNVHRDYYNGGAVRDNLSKFDPGVDSPAMDYQHLGLYNGDYWVAKRGFFVDLSPWDDEPATDEVDQPVGVDVATWDMILGESYRLRKGEFGICAGFLTWWLKYCKYGNIGGQHEPVLGEWRFVQRLTSYNMVNDGDAAFGLANASFFMHMPKLTLEDCVVPPQPKVEKKSGTVYLSFFMLDFDGSAWVNQVPSILYTDPARGKFPLNWCINPIIYDRIPQAIRFMMEKRSPMDFLAIEDDGAGYLDPVYLSAGREETVEENGFSYYNKFAGKLHKRFGIEYTAFFIPSELSEPWLSQMAMLSPLGMGCERAPKNMLLENGTPLSYVKSFHVSDGKGFTERMMEIFSENQKNGTEGFHAFRLIIMPPTVIANALEKCKAKYPNAKVEILSAPDYFRMMKESLTR